MRGSNNKNSFFAKISQDNLFIRVNQSFQLTIHYFKLMIAYSQALLRIINNQKIYHGYSWCFGFILWS